MLKKRDNVQVSEDIDTLLGENIKVTGKIEGKGNLRIDGNVNGDIDYDGDIIIGDSGTIVGNVKGHAISVGGTVHGNLTSSSKLSLLPSAFVKGDVNVANFVIHEEAKFEGNCKMSLPEKFVESIEAAESE